MTTAPVEEWVPDDTLAHRLVLVRLQAGLTQREAAARCGISFGEWQGMELGRGTRRLDTKVMAIARHLGVSRDWLMWGGPLHTPEPPPPGAECAVRDSNPEPADQESPQVSWRWAA